MCILVLKKKGGKHPSINTVKNCMAANPDGFSMAWNQGGEVKTYKTLDPRQFLQVYKDVTSHCSPDDTGMILHMRIATHGSVKVENCHCWTERILGRDMAFAHNGILQIPNRGDMTDSETFLRDYLAGCGSVAEFLDSVTEHIGMSKFGFIDSDGGIIHFGRFIAFRGALYSNSSYQGGGRSWRLADPRLWGSR